MIQARETMRKRLVENPKRDAVLRRQKPEMSVHSQRSTGNRPNHQDGQRGEGEGVAKAVLLTIRDSAQSLTKTDELTGN